MSRKPSYAEITMKSGAVVTFECTELAWKRSSIGHSLKWVTPDGAVRRAVEINLDEVAAVVFVDGSR